MFLSFFTSQKNVKNNSGGKPNKLETFLWKICDSNGFLQNPFEIFIENTDDCSDIFLHF